VVRAAVFLDRDGVINANLERDGKPVAPTTLTEFEILPGVEEAIRRLKAADYAIIVCTNQPDVGTGRTPRATVEAMHGIIRAKLGVDDIKTCYHTDADACACRKPKPGMLTEAARDFSIDLSRSYMIGDRWRDTSAGRAAGCLTIFIDYGYVQDGPNEPDHVVRSLSEAASIILDGDCRHGPVNISLR
jgi:D-glycero-D-manno-heptose 1,7-bisphosphate phosphatase